MLENYNNYFMYAEFVKTGNYTVKTSDITLNTWGEHFEGIMNIMRDGIELDWVHCTFIKVQFDNGAVIELSITDYFFNLIMWYLIIRVGDNIEPKHIFFEEAITRRCIKKYIDTYFITKNRKSFSNLELNNIIDDTLYQYSKVDEFSMYLANTINLEDTLKLMEAVPEFNDIMHADLSNIPLENVKDVGTKLTNRAIYHMTNSKQHLGFDHCLADSWRAQEGINSKQYKEFAINIGSKPNGQGGVFPSIINKSFLMNGVNDLLSYFIESSTGRTAQILAKNNIGSSGSFARLLGLNNTDDMLNDDPNYDCDTRNYQEVFITNETTLNMLEGRYYRMSPRGMEYNLQKTDKHMIEKSIYLRSPMTCASNSRGDGICYKCYGDLAYTNNDINIGKIAAEEISAKLTQILLSAKHLLETVIKKIEWSDGFFEIFEIDGNVIKFLSDSNFKGYYMIIDPEDIDQENGDDYKKNDYEDGDESSTLETYNEYITELQILTPSGDIININSLGGDNLYISNELNELIRKYAIPVDGKLHIPMVVKKEKDNNDGIIDCPLFFISIMNNELSKTMDRLMHIIDKNSVTREEGKTRHTLLQEFINAIIEGDLDITSVHCEMILSNQLRDVDASLEKPKWQYENEPCEILTLNQALTNNPSVVVSLLYQRLSKVLYNPLTFRKNKPSFMDLFFMEKPQMYLSDTSDIRPAVKDTNKEINMTNPIAKVKKVQVADEEECED